MNKGQKGRKGLKGLCLAAVLWAGAAFGQTPFDEPRHLWVAVDLSKPETAIRDAVTSRVPRVAWGNPLTVHVAFYNGASLVTDFTGLETLYLEVDETRTDEAGTPLVLEDVAVGSVDAALTAEQWAARTNEHVTFSLTAAQLQTTQRRLPEKNAWWIFHAARDDDAPLLLGMGEVTVYSTNATPTDTPPPALAETYPTPTEIESRWLPAGGTTGQSLTKNSGTDFDVEWTTISGGGGGSGEYANVIRDYGASGNGVDDDTAEIQAAVTGSLRIYLQDGTYNITSAITMREGTQIWGESEHGVIIRQLTSGADAFNIGATQTTECVISNLTITGNGISTSTGTAIDLKPTGGSWFSSRHNISNVTINGFGRGLHAYDAVLLDVVNFQTHETNEGILLEDVDTVRMMNIGIQAVSNGTVDYGIKATGSGTHAGAIYGAEIGNSAQAIVLQGGRWSVADCNIETNRGDGVVEISGSQTFAQLDRLRILTQAATVAGSAVILIKADEVGIPQVKLGALKIDMISGHYPIVVRGVYYYASHVVYQDAPQSALPIRYEASLGGDLYHTGVSAFGIPHWTYGYLSGRPPSDANNESDVGKAFYAVPNKRAATGGLYLKKSGVGSHYQNRMGIYVRDMWSNSELLDVLHADASLRTLTTEADAVSTTIPLNMLDRDGQRLVFEARGVFDSSGSDKRLKIRFNASGSDDWASEAFTDAYYAGLPWTLVCVMTRRDATTLLFHVDLLIDGQLPRLAPASETVALVSTSQTLPLATFGFLLKATQTTVTTSRMEWVMGAENE